MSLRQATAGTGHAPVTAAQRWVLALASVASFLVILDALVVATALTAIRRHLGASLAGLEWTVNAQERGHCDAGYRIPPGRCGE